MGKQTSWIDENGNLWIKDRERIEAYVLMGKVDLKNIKGETKEE